MTNRQWLESLTDEQLAAWLCNNLEIGEAYGFSICCGVENVKRAYIHSELGLIEWLKKNHLEENHE